MDEMLDPARWHTDAINGNDGSGSQELHIAAIFLLATLPVLAFIEDRVSFGTVDGVLSFSRDGSSMCCNWMCIATTRFS